MRRLAIALITAALALAVGLGLAAPASASTAPSSTSSSTPPADPPASTPAGEATSGATVATELKPVDVLQVSGLFDSVVVDSIHRGIADSVARGAQALILQLNSSGAVVSRDEMSRLLTAVADSPIPIGIWVGPSSSARAYGLPAQLFAVADVTAMVPGSRIGNIGDPLTYGDGKTVDFGASTEALQDGSMSFKEARAAGVLELDTGDVGVPTVRSMVLALDGVEARGVVLDTVVDVLQDDGQAQATSTLVRFDGLGLMNQLMHTVASPAMAYLLFVIGIALLIFEFFTAGVGIAGFVGAVCLILGCYGLAELPLRPVAIVLLVLAMLAFAIDVQVGVPRFWTGVGILLFIVASWFMYEPVDGNDMRLGWITLVVGIGGVMLTYIVGMPSMVRTRFATPTIGREWMIGHEGAAAVAIDPDGIAVVNDARWRARTNRATPIAAGEPLRVVAIDGVTLEVEPLEGAARDYRERRSSRSPADAHARTDANVPTEVDAPADAGGGADVHSHTDEAGPAR